jgi:hypothetical protein
MDVLGQPILRDVQWFQEIFAQDFPRMHRIQSRVFHAMLFQLVVIHDFNIPSVAVMPLKAYPPLVVDTDAVLPGPVAMQLFQPVGWRTAQV